MDIFIKLFLFVGVAALAATGYVALANWTRRSRPNWLGLCAFVVGLVAYIGHKNSTLWGWTVLIGIAALAGLIRTTLQPAPQPAPQPQPQPAQQQPAQPTPQETAAQKIVRLKKEGIFAGLTEEEAFKWAMEESQKTPKVDANQYFVSGKYLLWGFIPVPWATYFFYTKTNKLVLRIPVLFDMKEEYTEFGNWSDVSFYFGPFAGKVEYKPKVWLPQLPGRKSGDALIAVNIPKRIVREIKMNWINR